MLRRTKRKKEAFITSRFGSVEWEGGGGEWIPGHYLVFRRREEYVSYNKEELQASGGGVTYLEEGKE